MTLKEVDKKTMIRYRLEQSDDAINDAEFLLLNKKLPLAVNRIYYSVFYMLSAIALQENFSTSKHQQLIGWFNKKYVQSGLIEKKYSRLIYTVIENREKGDYDFLFKLTKEEIVHSLDQTKELLAQLKLKLNIE